MRMPIFAAALLASLIATAALAQPATLTIHFDNIAPPQGALMIAVYDSQAAYDGGEPTVATGAQVAGATADIIVPNLAEGEYAFKLFHDVNGNGKLDTNPFGLPVEPFAFSNNARGNMGPASWADARFTVTAAGAEQSIHF